MAKWWALSRAFTEGPQEPMQTQSKDVVPETVSLTVVDGPDQGMTESFRKARVTVGRDPRNDFVLSDGFVSNHHAELVVDDGELVFRDLESRHGTTVVADDVSKKLHVDESDIDATVEHGTEVQVGSSLIRLSVASEEESSSSNKQASSGRSAGDRSPANENSVESEDGEQLLTAAHRPVDTISRQLGGDDPRMAALFRLAGELNGLTTLDEVLDLIVETTFDAFPATNFFAVTLGSDGDEVSGNDPFLTRTRGELPGDEDSPILSTSIVRRVAETRESVLFTKDSIGAEVTESILEAQITACMAAPLVGQSSLLGIMQVDTRGRGTLFGPEDLELFNILASNAAFAIERARLTEDIVEMFEGFVNASVNAIEARDPVTAGHSHRVANYTLELAEVVNDIERDELHDIYLNPDELRELRYAALLHDFGKIAVGEDVLRKGTRLPDGRIQLIRQRFETIKELTYRRWLHQHVRRLENGDETPDAANLAELDGRYREFCTELDETFELLQHINQKGYLEDEDIERVRALGQRKFEGVDGHPHRYLTPAEVENLCIRKGTLNEEEWEEMRSHAALSESYLDQIPWSDELRQIPCIAGAHHEKLDGSGYPQGLTSGEIMPQVRMLTISDIFDALTASDRPYRKAAPIERAVEILNLESDDGKLDSDLVEVFEDLVIPRIEDDVPNPRE